MIKKIYITPYKQFYMTLIYEDDKLVEIYADHPEDSGILDRIYVGKVKNVVNNIQAAFIDIGKQQMGYYSLAENKRHNYTNGKSPEKVPVPGDEILVQVSRESVKTKGPTLTSMISLAGTYMVLTAHKYSVGISSKISDSKERKRLMDLSSEWQTDDLGYVLRTKAQGQNEAVLNAERMQLQDKLSAIMQKGQYLTCYSEVYKTEEEYIRRVMKQDFDHIDHITTDIPAVYEKLQDSECKPYLRLYDDPAMPLSAILSLETHIERALKPQVWLKNGGSLVITPTEAMVVIDVNTGKYTGKKKIENTFFNINKEAAVEIARQLRLRNLSGIIIVDFIDMKDNQMKQELLDVLQQAVSFDPVKTVVVDMTKLNLVEMTRKKEKKPLHEQMRL